MDGVVDVYMPDFKLWSSELTRRYLAKRDYAEVARHSVREMHRQVGALVTDERGMAQRGLRQPAVAAYRGARRPAWGALRARQVSTSHDSESGHVRARHRALTR